MLHDRQANGTAVQLATRNFYMFLSKRVKKNRESNIASSFSTLPIAMLLFLKAWFKYFLKPTITIYHTRPMTIKTTTKKS